MNQKPRRPARRPYTFRVGLDIGSFETRLAQPIGIGGEATTKVIWALAKRRTEHGINHGWFEPLRRELGKRRKTLNRFADKIGRYLPSGVLTRPWGVVACNEDASENERNIKRMIANKLFERTLFADEMFLAAIGLSGDATSLRRVIVDLGYRSTRVALIRGMIPSPESRLNAKAGGFQMDTELRRGLQAMYPDLVLTDHTLAQLKRKLSFVSPADRRAKIDVRFRGFKTTLDVTPAIENATEFLARATLKTIRELLDRCNSDEVEEFLRNVTLIGGGSQIAGMPARIELDLQKEGCDFANVVAAERPALAIARGACRWATMLSDEQWSVPLLSPAG